MVPMALGFLNVVFIPTALTNAGRQDIHIYGHKSRVPTLILLLTLTGKAVQ